MRAWTVIILWERLHGLHQSLVFRNNTIWYIAQFKTLWLLSKQILNRICIFRPNIILGKKQWYSEFFAILLSYCRKSYYKRAIAGKASRMFAWFLMKVRVKSHDFWSIAQVNVKCEKVTPSVVSCLSIDYAYFTEIWKKRNCW